MVVFLGIGLFRLWLRLVLGLWVWWGGLLRVVLVVYCCVVCCFVVARWLLILVG